MQVNFKNEYYKQLDLLLRVLPYVAEQECFCLKGGTAINLFASDLPRLSVDIDLTYVPINDRAIALNEIELALLTIKQNLLSSFANSKIYERKDSRENKITKLYVSHNNVQIIIEPNIILRGTLYPPIKMHLSKSAEELMHLTVSNVPVLHHTELYAGKICAALDRQHPRDLFDIKILYENGGLSDEIRQAVVIYVACNPRPIHELLNPNKLDISKIYADEFEGMTAQRTELNDLLLARDQLIPNIRNKLSDNEKQFLLSITRGEPDWGLLPFENISEMPALKWKIFNIKKMEISKRDSMVTKLLSIFE